jgi:hypothetical protein
MVSPPCYPYERRSGFIGAPTRSFNIISGMDLVGASGPHSAPLALTYTNGRPGLSAAGPKFGRSKIFAFRAIKCAGHR